MRTDHEVRVEYENTRISTKKKKERRKHKQQAWHAFDTNIFDGVHLGLAWLAAVHRWGDVVGLELPLKVAELALHAVGLVHLRDKDLLGVDRGRTAATGRSERVWTG
jgi:hypothetical protein